MWANLARRRLASLVWSGWSIDFFICGEKLLCFFALILYHCTFPSVWRSLYGNACSRSPSLCQSQSNSAQKSSDSNQSNSYLPAISYICGAEQKMARGIICIFPQPDLYEGRRLSFLNIPLQFNVKHRNVHPTLILLKLSILLFQSALICFQLQGLPKLPGFPERRPL